MSQKVVNNNLIANRKNKVTLILNKPAYAGMCELDLSKALMYEFHCEYIENKYGNKDRILFTDTATYYYLLLNQNFVINQMH